MKFLIIGRTATGKDTLANILITKYQWKFVKSMTDRARRTPEEDTHIFLSSIEFQQIPPQDIVAKTTINNHHYCATKQQLEESDGYIIDPNGCYQLLESLPDEQFIIVYLKAKDKLQQKFFALARNSTHPLEEYAIFQQRYEDENEQFIDFENMIEIYELFKYPNVLQTVYYLNIYDEESIELLAESLNRLKLHLK